jgi:hypothetical protein
MPPFSGPLIPPRPWLKMPGSLDGPFVKNHKVWHVCIYLYLDLGEP